MAIYVHRHTRVLVQGITGRQGSFHTAQMLAYGTRIVGGISPGKGGQKVEGVPVFNTVFEAMEVQPAEASILFIPAPFARDAAMESIAAGIRLLVLIPEHIPLHDAMEIMAYAGRHNVVVVGPNTFGLVSSGQCKVGIMPNDYFVPGPVGVVSRSGTLCYEIVGTLAAAGLGTSTVIGLGGDRVVGLSFIDVLQRFEEDEETAAVVLVGEIGGSAEEEAARFIAASMSKPVVAYIAGRSAPPGKRMGHAGAIIERGRGTFESKVEALEMAGVPVANLPQELPQLVKAALKR
ncbi:MAG TPA: succinate--CoA ligase subunit alpha [Bacillota bacterium]|jgi:succinyl-CoA synthetase alpha subunit|nr:succinate--CoA ligase subunit alpha [Bacillota bacterium]HOB86679.1 succinate--CoA ligase subunit alpha [Bacillota bacterium]HOP69793.1 succinate--CoA ligase subunit alpha [Bacillota bacterium]HPT34800.1 succinate--CoA ligase subunit alpha [Bacillota bacterium]HQD06615.1 succinate--CoA ligase subunit alpha [Bacillota bacterium]